MRTVGAIPKEIKSDQEIKPIEVEIKEAKEKEPTRPIKPKPKKKK